MSKGKKKQRACQRGERVWKSRADRDADADADPRRRAKSCMRTSEELHRPYAPPSAWEEVDVCGFCRYFCRDRLDFTSLVNVGRDFTLTIPNSLSIASTKIR